MRTKENSLTQNAKPVLKTCAIFGILLSLSGCIVDPEPAPVAVAPDPYAAPYPAAGPYGPYAVPGGYYAYPEYPPYYYNYGPPVVVGVGVGGGWGGWHGGGRWR